MKPEEAKQKWCPFTFGVLGRDNIPKEWFMCIAGECMAWQFNLKKQDDKPNQYKYPYEVDFENGYCKLIDK